MEIIKKIRIDIGSNGVPPYVDAVQGESFSRVLEISTWDGGSAWNGGEGTVSIAYKKPDGTSGWYDKLPNGDVAVTSSGYNVYKAVLAPEMLTVPGDVYALMRFDYEDEVLATFPFVVRVAENPSFGSVKSENYYHVQNWGDVNASIDQIFSDIDGLRQNVDSEIDRLDEAIGKIATAGGGLTDAEKALLLSLFKNTAYTADMSATIAQLETLWSSEEPDEPTTPDVTLTSISATYSGGNVPAGTAVSSLTGVKVTAHYSDGSTANVTGYTLSGTIKEGTNTITVSYGGKTTTFTVTGVADESGGDTELTGDENVVVTGAAATDDGNGNVTVTGMIATDDGNGNITVS